MKANQVAQLVKEDGTIVQVESTKRKFTLSELQGYVGGLIELVRLPNGRDMWINEEGKLEGMKLNTWATAFSGLFPHDVIVGPALVMGDTETLEKLKQRESTRVTLLALEIGLATGSITTDAPEPRMEFIPLPE